MKVTAVDNPQDDDDKGGILIGTPFELKFLLNGGDGPVDGMFEGYAASFNGVDSHGDKIAPGAFAESIAKHMAAGTRPALLWNHDPGQPIGTIMSMREDAAGLQIVGKLNLATETGKKAHAHMLAGEANGLSIGYQVPRGGAETLKGGLRLLNKITLHECSACTMPSDTRARVTSVKSAFSSRDELEEILTKVIPRGAVKKLVAGGWPAIIGAVDEPDPAIAAAALAETNAIAQLSAKVAAATLELKSRTGKRR
jgi:uncharacterized protein